MGIHMLMQALPEHIIHFFGVMSFDIEQIQKAMQQRYDVCTEKELLA